MAAKKRYCPMCDEWLRCGKECPKCGCDTETVTKEKK